MLYSVPYDALVLQFYIYFCDISTKAQWNQNLLFINSGHIR